MVDDNPSFVENEFELLCPPGWRLDFVNYHRQLGLADCQLGEKIVYAGLVYRLIGTKHTSVYPIQLRHVSATSMVVRMRQMTVADYLEARNGTS